MTNSVKDSVDQLRDTLEMFEENMEKYEFIIDYGDNLKELPEEFRNDKYRVLGCQSELWIKCFGFGKLEFKAYGEAKIVRGLAAMVIDIFSGKTREEILNTDPKILNNLGIAGILTPGRQNGIGNLIAKIYEFANERPSN